MLRNVSLLLMMMVVGAGSVTAWAGQQEFQTANYKEAKSAESYLRFDMASTKMGLVTTSFTGFVKKFSAQGEIKDQQLQSGARVEFQVQDMDTDINGRNEKMWEKCLDYKNHPQMKLVLSKSVPLNGEEMEVPALISLRGQEKPVNLKVKAVREEGKIIFDLRGEISLKAFEIPDPSIFVASVRDKVEIKGHILIQQ